LKTRRKKETKTKGRALISEGGIGGEKEKKGRGGRRIREEFECWVY
jgi:hypothetical protein